MTERLYYDDSYLSEFPARLLQADGEGRRLYLDRTAFYPTSGGQPFDRGTINGIEVEEVVDEGDRIAHVLREPLAAGEVLGRIDWARRFDHMQQHTGQHLLSAVLSELYEIPTVSFHLGQQASTMDVDARSLVPAQIAAAEERANQVVFENRPVSVGYGDAAAELDLRKPSERQGKLRIVTIENLDRSACGGTHVRATGEIGLVSIRKLDRMRGNVRIEFLCGLRAVRRARRDLEALSSAARTFGAHPDELPEVAAAQLKKSQEVERSLRRLGGELAALRGRNLYASTAPGPGGVRFAIRREPKGAVDDDLRALAQSFTSEAKAVLLACFDDPPALVLAASADSGLHAGDALKAALAAAGGRGGGSAGIAQASAPSREALEAIRKQIEARVAAL